METEQILTQLRSLNEVSKTLIRCESQEQAIQVALQEVRQRLKVQVASILMTMSFLAAAIIDKEKF